MIKKTFGIIKLMILIGVSFPNIALCWDDSVTHRDLSLYAAEVSVLGSNGGSFLKQFGISAGLDEFFTWNNSRQQVKDWLAQGGKLEDTGSRPFNHFHNPLQPWSTAGLSNLCLIINCQSALLWAQSYDGSQQPMADDWSWQRTRKLFNLALTSSDPAVRNAFFAETFRGLGQQMHLIQDMAVPAHVRNDAHPLDPAIGTNGHGQYFEAWTKNSIRNLDELKSFATSTIVNSSIPQLVFNAPSDTALAPITQFYDTNQYDGTNPSTNYNIGLAEYTNANYFSDDTINMPGIWTSGSHSFPYPNASSTNLQDYIYGNAVPTTVTAEDGVADRGFWIQKTGNEPITHFVKPGYFTTPLYNTLGGGHVYERTFFLDDQCHHDYAEKLLPRAIGYSASLLDYFFRGTLEITRPDTAVYSSADGSQTPYTDAHGNQHQQFTKIKANVTNTTPNGEAIGSGELRAVARYKIIPNYAPDLSNYPPSSSLMNGDGTSEHPPIQYSYSVSLPTPVNAGDIIPDYYTDFEFDFSNAPIPAGITDLTLQVVFKGTIGNEADNAIAVGMKDLMEPTHLTFWNLTDMYSLPYPGPGYSLYTFDTLKILAGQNSTLLDELDETEDGSLDDEEYLQPKTSTFTISFWTGWEWSTAVTLDIPPARHIRLIALVDKPTDNYVQVKWDDLIDPGTLVDPFNAVVNQADQSGAYVTPTPVMTFRKGYAADGQTIVPIKEHFYEGVVGCTTSEETTYCPYPEDQARTVENLTPLPFSSIFN